MFAVYCNIKNWQTVWALDLISSYTTLAYNQLGVSEFKRGCWEFILVAALHNQCDLSDFWKDPRPNKRPYGDRFA